MIERENYCLLSVVKGKGREIVTVVDVEFFVRGRCGGPRYNARLMGILLA